MLACLGGRRLGFFWKGFSSLVHTFKFYCAFMFHHHASSNAVQLNGFVQFLHCPRDYQLSVWGDVPMLRPTPWDQCSESLLMKPPQFTGTPLLMMTLKLRLLTPGCFQPWLRPTQKDQADRSSTLSASIDCLLSKLSERNSAWCPW